MTAPAPLGSSRSAPAGAPGSGKGFRLDPARIFLGLLALGGMLGLLLSVGRVQGVLLEARPFYEARIEGAAFPKTLVDPAGMRLTLPAPPQRIVSCTVFGDETLSVLIDPQRLVAVTTYSDDPKMSNCIGTLPPNALRLMPAEPETVLSLRPDLVVVAGFSRLDTVTQLTGAGVPVLRLARYGNFQEIFANIRTLAAAVGAEREAEALIASCQERIRAVERRVAGRPRPRVLYYNAGFTSGSDSLVDDMIRKAGGRNAATERGLRETSLIALETAITLNPEVIILSRYAPPESPEAPPDLLHDPLWREVEAVKRGRILQVPAPWLECLSHHGVKALERIAAYLHPERPGPGGPAR